MSLSTPFSREDQLTPAPNPWAASTPQKSQTQTQNPHMTASTYTHQDPQHASTTPSASWSLSSFFPRENAADSRNIPAENFSLPAENLVMGVRVDIGYTSIVCSTEEMQQAPMKTRLCLYCCPWCLHGPGECVSTFRSSGAMWYVCMCVCVYMYMYVYIRELCLYCCPWCLHGPGECVSTFRSSGTMWYVCMCVCM
jgi:hypothetical protein